MATLYILCKKIDAKMEAIDSISKRITELDYNDENRETIWSLVDERIKREAVVTRLLITWAKRRDIYGAYYTEADTEDRAWKLRETYRDYKKLGIHTFDCKAFAEAKEIWDELKIYENI